MVTLQEMGTIKLTFFGNPVSKKNQTHASVGRKTGKIFHYYGKTYQNWVRNSLPQLLGYKDKLRKEIQLPISEPIVLTVISYVKPVESGKEEKVRDVSNFTQTIEDFLAGNHGISVPKALQDITRFQIISDDNRDVIRNLGGSTILYDAQNPRVEVFISPFTLEQMVEVFKIWHKGVTPGLDLAQEIPVHKLPNRNEPDMFEMIL